MEFRIAGLLRFGLNLGLHGILTATTTAQVFGQ
jgi:hypothetical protein